MKKIIPLVMIILFSTTLNAQNSYQNLWEKVEKFEIDNLPKSALKVVNEIYTKAEKSNNSPQIIKCLFYKSKFSQILEESSQLKIINQFKEHISKSKFPTKNVLENILANLYWQFFQQNRWKFYNRTQTATKVDPSTSSGQVDFRTWDLNTLFTEIHSQFQTSLNDKKALQKIDIKKFSAILHLAKDGEKYRPTLYDFLANNALDFYKTDETNITKPAYQFKIDNENLLSNAEKFLTLKLASKDSLSLQFNVLKIYQDLTTFHLKNKNLKALADVDLQRLNFVKQHATFSNKTECFLDALKSTKKQYKNDEFSGLYAYEIAKIYIEQANYKNEKLRFKNKEALAICNNINKRFPKSNGTKKCNTLKQQILSKSLNITVEKFTPIQQFQRVLVNYKNVDELYFSVYQINQNQLLKLHKLHKDKEKTDFINGLSEVKNWSAKLKNEHDYLQHTTEVIVPKLAQGSYLLVASTDEKLTEKSAFGFDDIQITNLAFVQNSVNGKSVYQTLNRNTGKPIANAKVNLHNKPHTNNRYYKKLDKHFTTDKNGEFTFNSKQYYGNVKAVISYKNDKATFDGIYINQYYKPEKNNTNKHNEIVIFTDRSIYRPSQTVYFKGILFEKNGKTSKILTNKKVKISLKNVNYQEVKKLEVTTNDFGSFSGEFILPSSVLTGTFSIVATFENRDFSDFINVEEYKRPKFETDFKPITKSYKLNNEIELTGFAKAFSGVKISDAKVVYRVHRKVQYPSWWYWYRPNFHSSPQEIKYGELTTDENGNFTIKFNALPDESVDKNNNPVFTYEVTADVTDINGETRSAKTEVKVGYHSLITTISVDKELDVSKKNHIIKIDTKNLNGEFVSAKGAIKIYKLIPPKNILRKRPWNAPDYQEISEQEFREKFPNDAYKNEDNFINWKKGKLVFSEDFNTKKSKETLLKSIKKWQSGKYIVELKTQDRYGQKVDEKSYFSVINTKDKIPTDNQLFSVTTDKENYKIGDVAKITFSTNSEDVTVMVFVEKQRKVIESKYIHLNKNSKTISVPVSKNDVGGFGISYYFINYNSFIRGSKTIAVPYPKTDLEIITKTFRDKLQPGENQTWSFTIKGAKKDKAFAEVLASMYDVSLDEFTPHNWKFNPIYKPVYNVYNNANARNSFQNSHLNFRNLNNNFGYYGISSTSYSKLKWFGFSFNGDKWVNREYLRFLTIQRTKFDGTISGVVEDETGALPGVSILVKGTEFGTETDYDGKFNIKVNKGDVLVFSFVGMKTIERKVGEFGQMIVLMDEDEAVLDEIVVTGYGKAKNYSPPKMKARGMSGRVEMAMSVPPPPSASPKSKDVARDYAPAEQENKKTPLKGIQIRKNLQETAFFYPHLTTDKNGNISFNFTIPEALTKWKLQLLAHTKKLHSATKTLETVTQKELMITPNAPRFLRQGDKITLSAKISNLSDKTQQGLAQLILTDAVTGKEINLFDNSDKNKFFVVNADGNTNVLWNLSIPNSVDAVQYKIVAKSDDFSDGEQNVLPVLSNRMLVTETLPMWVRSNQTKTFKSPLTPKGGTNGKSPSFGGVGEAFRLTLEVTSNPAWYAVQALPYLMEYPYECSEQTFARYYANTLASFIANSNPRIQEVFNSWKNSDALLSNLEKNQELKSLIIQETPWLRDAQSETEQKKRIALLFDLNKMKNEQEKAIRKLKNMQMSNGGFPWFKGGRYPNAYITQHIASGFGHLKKLGVTKFDKSVEKIIEKAVHFMDEELADNYQKLLEQAEKIKAKKGVKKYEEFLEKKHIYYFELQYLYMRSFYGDITIPKKTQKAIDYYKNQAKTYWNDFNLYGKGLNALVQFRNGDKLVSSKILNSLKENSITSEELGMYWKSNTAGYYNYQAPIETQALLIEAFSEIENDAKTIDNLKIWLLKNKQVSQWKTTKATTEAVYALLLQGSDWLSVTDLVEVTLGDTKIDPTKIPDVKVEAGTGYFKTSFTGDEIKSKMGDVTIKSKGKSIAWGGLYWQYFEDLDKITSAETPLKLNKKLFKKVNSDTGKKLIEITDKSTLKVGDLLTVRIELRSDRDMEFIHMKDMRASGVEPINVLSKYKWQDGLGYYESTKDASTNFFFSRLPKGVYVFEYDVRVNNAGDFSNGITIIENMYAPEFKSHSEGVRLHIE